jgi:ubiquitin-conjugating enzyme E2 variant
MPKITGKGKGAALMRDVPGTARLLRAMRQTIAVPFTIKIRGGWDDLHLNAVEVARMAESEGVDAITVHPRTRSQRFTGARRVQARKGPTMIPKKQPDRSINRTHSIAILDAVHVLLASVFAVGLTLRVASTTTVSGLVPLALGLALGFLTADVASGLVHWFCDRYFQPNTLLIGPMIIAPFRQHHIDPTALGRHGVLERNGNNCLAALPFLALAAFEPWDLGQPWAALARGFLGGFSLTLCLTNEIHAWAHSSSPPQLVTWLQRCGILLARERHAAHHRDSHSRAYAVVCGWSNLWLDCILVRAEVVLASLGVSPSERGSKQ